MTESINLVRTSAPTTNTPGRPGDSVYDPADPGYIWKCVTQGGAGEAEWVRYAISPVQAE